LDAERSGAAHLPLASERGAALNAVASFLGGNVDDDRLSELLWGLALVDQSSVTFSPRQFAESETVTLSRQHALLKVLFLPADVLIPSTQNNRVRFAREKEIGIRVRPELRVLSLLRGGHVSQACAIAVQRLRSSGLAPIEIEWEQTNLNGWRLGASLLIPIAEKHLGTLLSLCTESLSTAEQASA
jgi:CRISPR-associated protein Csx17